MVTSVVECLRNRHSASSLTVKFQDEHCSYAPAYESSTISS